MSPTKSKSSLLVWLLFIGCGLAFAFLSGRLTVHQVPDSPSYLEYTFGSLDRICRSIRTPGYPLWLLLFQQTIGIQFVRAAQVIVHATAAWWLLCELARWGMPLPERFAVAVAVGIGCTAMDHIHTVSTDALAASLGVITVTSVLRWARLEGKAFSWLPVVIAAVIAVFVRPAYLFLVPWILVGGVMLRRLRGCRWRSAWWSSITVSLITLLPLIAWMTMRLAVVGDFGILPFGHQNLAGILVQLVSDEELRETGGELGSAIIQAKHRFDTEVGFAEGDPGATMTIDARWDDMTWKVVFPAAMKTAGDDIVTSHRALAKLNQSIIKRYPVRYAMWLVKAARRAAWVIAADIMMHPVFLIASGLMILVVLQRAVVGGYQPVTIDDSSAMRALTIITFTYLIAKVGFIILTSPPIGRFSDSAAIFVPAWVAVVFLRWWRPSDDDRQSPGTVANHTS